MSYLRRLGAVQVNCRVGSLEMAIGRDVETEGVNCRVGSLEIYQNDTTHTLIVNCRVGSLEIWAWQNSARP